MLREESECSWQLAVGSLGFAVNACLLLTATAYCLLLTAYCLLLLLTATFSAHGFEEAFGVYGCHASGSYCGDGLAVGEVLDVSTGKYAGDIGFG